MRDQNQTICVEESFNVSPSQKIQLILLFKWLAEHNRIVFPMLNHLTGSKWLVVLCYSDPFVNTGT